MIYNILLILVYMIKSELLNSTLIFFEKIVYLTIKNN